MDLDIYELLLHFAKQWQYDADDVSEEDLDELIIDRYGIDSETYSRIVKDLLPLCDKAVSPLTGKTYKGFGTDYIWLLKTEVKGT